MSIPLRPFGRTGVKVSALALGTMMFGQRGNPDHDDSVRVIRRGARRRDQSDRHRRRVQPGRVGDDRRQGHRGPARRGLPRHQVPRPDRVRPEPLRQLPPVDHPGDREQPAPACRQPGRFQIDAPENAAKLDAVESLAQLAEQAGLSLIHLALAFVLEHPAVTAPIIGTRTYEQLEGQLDAAQVRLSPDVLDEIDKIVPPGTTLSARDQAYRPPALTDPARRRRG